MSDMNLFIWLLQLKRRDQHIWVRLRWNVSARTIRLSTEELISEDFKVFGTTGVETWHVLLVPPRVNNSPDVGLFLFYGGGEPMTTFFEIAILNSCPENSVVRAYKNVNFDRNNARGGSYDFIRANELLDPNKGFINDGKINIVVQLPTVRDDFEAMIEQEHDVDKWTEIPPVVEISDDDVVEISDEDDVVDISDEDASYIITNTKETEMVVEISDDEAVSISDESEESMAVNNRGRQEVTIGTGRNRPAIPLSAMEGLSRGAMRRPLATSGVSTLRQPPAASCKPVSYTPANQSIPVIKPRSPTKLKPQAGIPSATVTQIPSSRRSLTPALKSQAPMTTKPMIPSNIPRQSIPAPRRIYGHDTVVPSTAQRQVMNAAAPRTSIVQPCTGVTNAALSQQRYNRPPTLSTMSKIPLNTEISGRNQSTMHRGTEPTRQATSLLDADISPFNPSKIRPPNRVPGRPLFFDTTLLVPTTAPDCSNKPARR